MIALKIVPIAWEDLVSKKNLQIVIGFENYAEFATFEEKSGDKTLVRQYSTTDFSHGVSYTL